LFAIAFFVHHFWSSDFKGGTDMRSGSRVEVLVYLAALALLGVLCGILPPFATSPYQMAKARNVPTTVNDSKMTEEKPSLHAQQIGRIGRAAINAVRSTPEQHVRHLLWRAAHCDCAPVQERRALVAMGEKAFPTYEAILSGPEETSHDVWAVLTVLSSVLGDGKPKHRRFLTHATSRLTDSDSAMRASALAVLKRVGSPTEASLVVALLSDEERSIIYNAAETLAVIGGPNEVVAMDVWLRGVSHREDIQLREQVQKCRDELKKRLDDAKDPKKRSQLRQRCWNDLTGTGEEAVVEVDRAVRGLSVGGAETVAFLNDRVRPVPVDRQKHLDQLLADLDSDSFERREAATREMSRGVVAEAVLEKLLANRPSLEQKRRLEAILEDFPDWRTKNPELLRSIRAIWVLQQIGTPEARALLEKLAAGAPSAALTQKAKDALQSLDRLNKKR
jgi:HEAT repeat protein